MKKYFGFPETQIRSINGRPTPTKGRIMIVANAGRDAVDANSVRHANACWTKTLIAYGKIVWS
jgi:hypothetical protein